MKQEILEGIVEYLRQEIDYEVLHRNLLLLKSESLRVRAKYIYFADGNMARQLDGVNQFYHIEKLPYCDATAEQGCTQVTLFPENNLGKDFSLDSLVGLLSRNSFDKFGVFRNIFQLPPRTPLDEPQVKITCLGLFAHKENSLLYVAGFGFKKELGKVSADEWACRALQGSEEELKEMFRKEGYKITPHS